MSRSAAHTLSLSLVMTGVWLAGLLGLALVAPEPGRAPGMPVCYSHTNTTSVFQDAHGAHTVLIRNLRPVFACP